MKIIGLAGRKRSGKDTVASILRNNYNFSQLAYADSLKAVVKTLTGVEEPEDKESEVEFKIDVWDIVDISKEIDINPITLSSLLFINLKPWLIGAESGGSIPYKIPYRKLVQLVGTDVVRTINDDIWIERCEKRIDLLKKLNVSGIVVSDVRFNNEAQHILNMGGEVWQIERQGLMSDTHSSEVGIDSKYVSKVLYNNSTIEELELQVIKAMQEEE